LLSTSSHNPDILKKSTHPSETRGKRANKADLLDRMDDEMISMALEKKNKDWKSRKKSREIFENIDP